MPVLATYFSVRRGRDPFFKFFMKTIFPRQVRDYEQRFGCRRNRGTRKQSGRDGRDNRTMMPHASPELAIGKRK